MKGTTEIINTRQLREEMPRVVRGVRQGRSFLVLHRSRPAFQLVPPDPALRPLPPLEQDPLYGQGALGRSADGLVANDHDRMLYGA